MKLHTVSLSPNGRKAESLLGYLGLQAEIRQVNLPQGEHKAPAFLALNPNGKIPVLEDGDVTVWESNAILTYLGAKHPESKLLPTDLKGRSVVDSWLFWQTAHFGPAAGKLAWELYFKKLFNAGDPDPALVEAGKKELAQFVPVLEQQLAGKDFVCGSLSVVDFAIAAWAEVLPRIGFGFNEYPNVNAWLGRVTSLKGWAKQP